MSSDKSFVDEIVDAAVTAFEHAFNHARRRGPDLSNLFNEDIEVGRPHLDLSRARSIEIVIDPDR